MWWIVHELKREVTYFLVGFFLGLTVTAALAHGDAAWIMAEPSYKSVGGNVHCCGPRDCERAPKGSIIETRKGFHIPATGQFFNYGQAHGLYPSIDETFWWCRWGGEVKCVFFPARGV